MGNSNAVWRGARSPTLPSLFLRLDYTGSRGNLLSHFISFVRIPALAIRQYIRPLPPLGVLDEDRLRMRVWPNDIDLNLHMNNARYLSVMDYARTHLLARTRLLEHIVRSRWQPLVGAAWLTYRRSLPLFSAFSLTSRMICWDEKWFYIEQTFTRPRAKWPPWAGSKAFCATPWQRGAAEASSRMLHPASSARPCPKPSRHGTS